MSSPIPLEDEQLRRQEEEGSNSILSLALQHPSSLDANPNEPLLLHPPPSSELSTNPTPKQHDTTKSSLSTTTAQAQAEEQMEVGVSVLCNLLWERQWEAASQLIQNTTEDTCRKISRLPCFSSGAGCGLPLHLVCAMRPIPPFFIVEMILRRYPGAASQKASMWGLLPLHLAADLRKPAQAQSSSMAVSTPRKKKKSHAHTPGTTPNKQDSKISPLATTKDDIDSTAQWSNGEEETPSAVSVTTTGISAGSNGSDECSAAHVVDDNNGDQDSEGYLSSVGSVDSPQDTCAHDGIAGHEDYLPELEKTDHCRIIQLLLDIYPKATLAKEEFQGMLPLHIAASSTPATDGKIPPACAQIIKLLLQYAPQTLLIKDYAGDTPFVLAERSNNTSHQAAGSTTTSNSSPTTSRQSHGSGGGLGRVSSDSTTQVVSLLPDWTWNPILQAGGGETGGVGASIPEIPTISLLVGSVDDLMNMSSSSENSSDSSSSSSSSSSQSCTSSSYSSEEEEGDTTMGVITDSYDRGKEDDDPKLPSYEKVLRQELEDSIRAYCPTTVPTPLPEQQLEVASSTAPVNQTDNSKGIPWSTSVPELTDTDKEDDVSGTYYASVPEMTCTYDSAVDDDDCSESDRFLEEKCKDELESCTNPVAAPLCDHCEPTAAALNDANKGACSIETGGRPKHTANDQHKRCDINNSATTHPVAAEGVKNETPSKSAEIDEANSETIINNSNQQQQGPTHKLMADSTSLCVGTDGSNQDKGRDVPTPIEATPEPTRVKGLIHEDDSPRTVTRRETRTTEVTAVNIPETNLGNLSELLHQLKTLQEENKAYSKEVERLKQRVSIMSEVKGVKVDDLKTALETVCDKETAANPNQTTGDHVVSLPDVLNQWRQELCGETATESSPSVEPPSCSPEDLRCPNLDATFSDWHDELVKEGAKTVLACSRQRLSGDSSTRMIAIVPSTDERDNDTIVGLEILIFDEVVTSVQEGDASNTSVCTPQQSATLVVTKVPESKGTRFDLLREILQTTRRRRLREIVSRSTQKQRSFDTDKVVQKIILPRKRQQNVPLLQSSIDCLDEAFDDVWERASLVCTPCVPGVSILSTGNSGIFCPRGDFRIVDHNPDSFADMQARDRRMMLSAATMEDVVERSILGAEGSAIEASSIFENAKPSSMKASLVEGSQECLEEQHCNTPSADGPATENQSCFGNNLCNFWAVLEATQCALACVEKFTEAQQSLCSNLIDLSNEGQPASAAARAACTERDNLLACTNSLKMERNLLTDNHVSTGMLSRVDSLITDLDETITSLSNHSNTLTKWSKNKNGSRAAKTQNLVKFSKKRAASYTAHIKNSAFRCGLRRSTCL